MTIKPAKYNIIIYQNATFNPVWTWKNSDGTLVNLTGYTAKMQGRTAKFSTTTIFDLTTENGGITLGGSAGTISLLLTAAQTAALTVSGVYDLILIPSVGVDNRLMEGTVTLSQGVTK